MKRSIMSLAAALVGLFATTSANATVLFSDNFEASGAAGKIKPSAPWEMNKEVFSSSGGYVDGYYPGTTYKPGVILTGEGGVDQGTYQAKLYPDFDYRPSWENNQVVKTSLLFNRTLTAEDIAPGTIKMDFNFKTGNIGATAGVFAFAKLLNSGFNETWYSQYINLSSVDWSTGVTSLAFNGTQVGANAQFGFMVVSSNDQAADLFIDNIVIASIPEPSVASLLGFGVLGLVATRFRRRS